MRKVLSSNNFYLRLMIAMIILLTNKISWCQVQQTWAYSHIAELRDQVVDANGNIYQASRTWSEAFEMTATLMIKHDKTGAEIWRRFLPSLKVATALAIDASGNVYVTGIYSPLFFSGGIIYIGDDEYAENVQINTVKLNASGDVQWSNIYFGEDSPLYGIPRAIVVDENGNPYVTGALFSSLETPEDSATADMATIKYNGPTGDRIWVKRYNGSTPGTGFDEAKAMTIDATGYIYVTGTSQLNGEMDIATIKYSPAGDEQWVQRFSNTGAGLKNDYAIPGGIKLDIAGNVFVVGSSKAGADVGGSGGEGKRVIIKYTFTGFPLWVRERNISYWSLGPIVTDNANNIIESTDGYTKKYNAAGDLLWTINHSSAEMTVDGNNDIYSITGDITGTFVSKFSGNTGVLLWERSLGIHSNGLYIGIDAVKNVYASSTLRLTYSEGPVSYHTFRYSQCEIIIPPSTTINSEPGVCGAQVNMAPSSTGDCGEIIIRNALGTRTFSLDSFYSVGHYHLEAYSPSTGATKRFTIYVEDHELPVINCPQNKILNTDPGVCYVAAVNAAVGTATATDNCDATVTVRGVRSDGLALTANYPPGITTITWTARDPSLNTATCTQTITVVDNVPPTITGESASVVVLSPSNHTMRDVTINYTATDGNNCGVTSVIAVTSNEPINGVGDGDTDPDWIVTDNHHVVLRAERSANGTGRIYTITITATDGYGNTAAKTVEVRVPHNIKNPHSGQPFKVGSTVTFEGEFWDKAGNSHSAKLLIDENTTVKATVTEPAGNKNGKVTGSYKFTAPGVYKLQMNVTDQKGITHYSNTAGDLEAIVVIYDPNGGYAYGGGYYNSPAGALRSSPSATGKASYGFTLNYFKNSTYPKGETQFDFKVGSFEFNALNFEYLVINNSMSQFKGTGKIIGGQSGVGFTMTVVDGQLDGSGVDKIRMKIYNRSNGSIIYDNQPGASDAALPTQAVGTNSTIVISGTNSSLTQSNTTQKAEMEATAPEVPGELNVIAYPNPSATNFSVSIKTNSVKGKITMQVVDMYGRIIETRNVNANSPVRFGDRYNPGTYFVRILQGKEHKEIKLIKLSD